MSLRNHFHVFLITIFVLFAYPAFAARAEIQFTDAQGARCKDYSKPEFGNWVCPGPDGYAIAFADEGNIVSLTIAPAHLVLKALSTAQWLGANKAFGAKVEWIVRDGDPKAALIRTWRRKSVEDSTEVQELSVFAINRDVVCSYSAVNAKLPHANELATVQAEQAADWRCPKN